jgi:hypothetical protein
LYSYYRVIDTKNYILELENIINEHVFKVQLDTDKNILEGGKNSSMNLN